MDPPWFVSVVDDEQDLAYLFKDALSQIPNVRVFAFSDPSLAFEHFLDNYERYACVVSDYRMPKITGIELLEKVKKINPQVTGVLFSAFDVEDKLFGNCKCVDKFLQKPVSMADLICEIQKRVPDLGSQEETEPLVED